MTGVIDRRVHATSAAGDEVVRYDRAGRWWLERADGTRAPLRLTTAVAEAIVFARTGGRVHLGLLGGRQFDVAYRRADTTQAR